jgi:dihydroxy-acid dehydratase
MNMEYKKNSKVFSDDDPQSLVRRSMFYACGLTHQEIKRPIVAVVNTYNEMHPGHMHLRMLADRVKAGIRTAGGVGLEFSTIALCDGLAMGHDGMKFILPSRQVIADSIELALRAHCYDAAVMLGSCDKIIPALLMAAARVDIPTVIVTGGPMPPGFWPREKVKVSVSSFDQLVKKVIAPNLAQEIREEALASFYPCAGACWGMGTANTMACLSEALGMSLPGDGTAPAVSAKKQRLAEEAGEKVIELLGQDMRPSDIMTRSALENALKVNLAIGGSLNTVLHLPALAHELGMHLGYADFDALSRQIPHLTNIEPAGPYSVVDLDEAGGIPGVMKTMQGLLDTTTLSVTGETIGDNLHDAAVFSDEVIRPLANPVHPYGGIAVLKGNLAEQGAVIKQVAVNEDMWHVTRPARVFNSHDEAVEGLLSGRIGQGDIIVIRYEGPKGSPGMPEMALFRAVLEMLGMGDTNYIVTDGRFSGYSNGPSIGYLSPEAAEGGTIALVQDGDPIEIDIEARKLELHVPETELRQRREHVIAPVKQYPKGYLDIYKRLISSADKGGVLVAPED